MEVHIFIDKLKLVNIWIAYLCFRNYIDNRTMLKSLLLVSRWEVRAKVSLLLI